MRPELKVIDQASKLAGYAKSLDNLGAGNVNQRWIDGLQDCIRDYEGAVEAYWEDIESKELTHEASK